MAGCDQHGHQPTTDGARGACNEYAHDLPSELRTKIARKVGKSTDPMPHPAGKKKAPRTPVRGA
jgi:hypothetical protein